jgi:hypothetical protein
MPIRVEEPMRGARTRLWSLAVGLGLALACGARDEPAATRASEPPAPAAAAPAPAAPVAAAASAAPEADAAAPPARSTTRRARTVTASGEVFEAEYGGESQLPSDFPNDVPIYAAAHPMSSMSSASHGTIVNLRSNDAPERVFDWYKEQMPAAGWRVESEGGGSNRYLLTLRKGDRVASLVIASVPEFTSVLLTLRTER